MVHGVNRLSEWLSRTSRPGTGTAPGELRPLVEGVDLDTPLGSTAAALAELDHLYLADAVRYDDPRYAANLSCPVVIPAVLAETVLSALNTSVDNWDDSVGATLVEQRLIRWTAELIGFGAGADGVFTSGGTQSNLHALLLAREIAADSARNCDPGIRTVHVLPRLRVLTSEHSHFSVARAAELMGLGSEAVVAVPTDNQRRMCPRALSRAFEDYHTADTTVMAVVATAGTTDYGSIDPITEIAAQCRERGVWLHVDAAYGGGLLVSPRRRNLLAGIEMADTVTVDFHKTYFQPVSSSALVVRDGAVLGRLTHHAVFLNPADDPNPNLADKSLQTTRRFDALKLWLTLRVLGPRMIGAMVDAVIDLADEVWGLLDADPRFRVLVRPSLSTLVFRYEPTKHGPPEVMDAANRHARHALRVSNAGVVAATSVAERTYLKFTLLNPRATVGDFAGLIEDLAGHAHAYTLGTADSADND
ncbi:lysine decarboxylase DesA [Streptomonospora salina]